MPPVSLLPAPCSLPRHLGQRDDNRRLLHVVEYDHVVVERERQIGELAVVGRRVRKLLDVADRVIARVSHCAAGERRQARNLGDADRLHSVAQHLERIVGREVLRALRIRDRDFLAVCRDREKRFRCQEAIAAYLFAADHALEQTCTSAIVYLVKRAHRCEHVAQHASKHGHVVGSLRKF
jgi:hypothetical protein